MEKINNLSSLFPDERNLEKTNVRKCHSAMFRILKYLDYLCRKNNLRYWICGGTLIGAIIHKGWKPLSKDIDISLPEKDYNALLKIVKKNLLEGVKLEILKEGLFRLKDNKGKYTKGYFKGNGIWVDIAMSNVSRRLFSIYYKCQMDEGFERKFSKKILLPLREYEFEGHYFFGPNKPIEFLKLFDLTRGRLEEYLANLEMNKILRRKYEDNEEIVEVDFMISE